MTQRKPCLVSTLGLQEHEIRLVQSVIKHSNERHPGRYVFTPEEKEAHVVLVNADSDEAMRIWVAESKQDPMKILLLISPKLTEGAAEYSFARPFAPTKILTVLEKILKEKLEAILESQIFVGEFPQQRRESLDNIFAKTQRVLVVDDSPTVLKQVELELKSFDVQVDLVETGEACLERVDDVSYDLILLDVVLPGVDGYEVCKKIKKTILNKSTPVIMLTSKSSSFDRVRGAIAGCASYLTKPVDYEKFHKVLDDYLG